MKGKRWKRHRIRPGAAGLLLLICLAVSASGCLPDRKLPLRSGSYQTAAVRRGESMDHEERVVGLDLYFETRTVHFVLDSGKSFPVPFSTRDPSRWPSGCPGNLFSYKMEVLDLEETGFVPDFLALEDPILVRSCPGDPYQLVLRSDGAVGGPSSACSHPEPCLIFGPSP